MVSTRWATRSSSRPRESWAPLCPSAARVRRAISSKADARRKIQGGGIYLNNRRVSDAAATATVGEAIEGRFLVLRQGKRQYHLVRVVGL